MFRDGHGLASFIHAMVPGNRSSLGQRKGALVRKSLDTLTAARSDEDYL